VTHRVHFMCTGNRFEKIKWCTLDKVITHVVDYNNWKWSTHIVTGHVTGLETSALRWRSYALVTLRCWQPIYSVLDDGTPPPVHTVVMEPMKWHNIWSYTARCMIGSAGVVAQTPLPKRCETPVELPGEDRGSDPSSPPRPAMRDRERTIGPFYWWQRSHVIPDYLPNKTHHGKMWVNNYFRNRRHLKTYLFATSY